MFRSRVLPLLIVLVAAFMVGCGHGSPKPGRPASKAAGLISSVEAEPAIPEPTAADPVTAAAWVDPGTISPGLSAQLHVQVRVFGGFYLHPADAKPPFVPTKVDIKPSDVLLPSGDWTLVRGGDAGGHLSGTVELRSRLRLIDGATPGRHEIACRLTFQACNPELCWPPRVLELHAPYVVSAVR